MVVLCSPDQGSPTLLFESRPVFHRSEILLILSLTSLTSMLVAPASSEFSMSSLTAELTEVITCELAINRTVDEGSRFITYKIIITTERLKC